MPLELWLKTCFFTICKFASPARHSAEDKIRFVLEGLRGVQSEPVLRWSKEFLEAGKKRLAGDMAREATSDEVKDLRAEARQLKETLAEVLIENRLLKPGGTARGRGN